MVMFDFEQVLHLGSRDQFESAHIVSCLFHWKHFWDYFVKTRRDTYDISCWNISGMMKENLEIVNRTNKPLAAYNRRLPDTFGAPHPSILNFVDVLNKKPKTTSTNLSTFDTADSDPHNMQRHV
ncbi:hypothetical protein PPTG_19839 [Phytophthora nicotianae INRA-310]|uniref:Uncharacterized protein n=1 Tax=Phytophthora nicotianae (strain INRA-310) TaxID=761204 RepID=W2PCW4_PHYN3|nr:hypothetical protein PPTG_19839 [Phytophthora nicotianae INRA-310]ETM98063.1 hypothetical protein PPTG_19839 [Phytophthora nicotianae INRA-310]